MSKRSLTKLAVAALLSAAAFGCSNSPDVRAASTSHSAVAVQPGAMAAPAETAPQAPVATRPTKVSGPVARPAPAAVALPRATSQSRPAPVPSATPMKAPMVLLYTRTGGIAGFQDEVRVRGDQLTVTRRGKVTTERKLTAEELDRLRALAAKADAAPVPKATKHRPVPDAFNISVAVGSKRVAVSDPPQQLDSAWEELAQALQGLMSQVR